MMKKSVIVTTLLAARCFHGHAKEIKISEVKRTEIKPEDADGSLQWLVQSGIFQVPEKKEGGSRRAQQKRSNSHIRGLKKDGGKKHSKNKDDISYVDDYFQTNDFDDIIVEDDDTVLDDVSYSGERVYVLEGFLDKRHVGDPIYVNSNAPDNLDPGNVHIFVDAPLHDYTGVDYKPLIGLAQGSCTRTDSEGMGVCQFTFEMMESSTVVASFTAEGPVRGDINGDTLIVTGGLGELDDVSGEITLWTATLDETISPPNVLAPVEGLDFLNDGDGYYMLAQLSLFYDPGFDDIFVPTDIDSPEGYDINDYLSSDETDDVLIDDWAMDDVWLVDDDAFYTD